MSFTNYYEQRILGLIFKGITYWKPDIIVDLCRGTPSERGGLDKPPSAAGYASAITETGTWRIESPGRLVNDLAIIFPEAEDDWGTITYLALSDASYYDMVLAYGALPPTAIVEGMRVVLVPGSCITVFS